MSESQIAAILNARFSIQIKKALDKLPIGLIMFSYQMLTAKICCKHMSYMLKIKTNPFYK